MRRTTTLALAAALLFVSAPAARGAGFLIYEHGAAAMAMAGAFTSLAKDPSALWHNPAGIAWLDGTRVLGGATIIVPRGSVEFPDYPGAPSYRQESAVFAPPNVYLTHAISKKAVLGVGVFAPYGLGITWPEPESFPWRYLGTSGEMETLFINPAVAFKLGERLSLGLGASFIMSELSQSVTQRMDLGEVTVDVPSTVSMDGTAFGFNAGLLYRGAGFRIGLNYRSRFKLDYSGTVSLEVPTFPEPFEGTGETSFRFPDIVTMGLSFDLSKKLVWAVDLHYVFWSSYDSYTVHIEVPDLDMSEDLEVPGAFTEDSGYEAARILLSQRRRPGAVFAANDSMALGLLAALHDHGVDVPGEIALAGFDDIPMARYVAPPLTTVRVSIPDLGTRATERLLYAIQAKPDPGGRNFLKRPDHDRAFLAWSLSNRHSDRAASRLTHPLRIRDADSRRRYHLNHVVLSHDLRRRRDGPGQHGHDTRPEFHHTWQVRNTGSCAWEAGFKFAFTSGESMSGAGYTLAQSIPAKPKRISRWR